MPRAKSSPASDRPSIAVYEFAVDPPSSFTHPMVRATAKVFAEIAAAIRRSKTLEEKDRLLRGPRLWLLDEPKRIQGRFVSEAKGCLRITASLARISSILHFHDEMLSALATAGCTIGDSLVGRMNGADIRAFGVGLRLAFIEDYKEISGLTAIGDRQYAPLKTCRLKLVRQSTEVWSWAGALDDLFSAIGPLANEIVERLRREADNEPAREARAAVKRAEAQKQREEAEACRLEARYQQERAQARRDQFDRAAEAASALQRHRAVGELVSAIEASPRASEPAVRVWLSVVRSQLVDPLDAFVQGIIDVGSQPERPMWWPEDLDYPG